MPDDWTVVFEHRVRRPCADRALVLTAMNIPHEIGLRDGRWGVGVPAAIAEHSGFGIWQYGVENGTNDSGARGVEPVYQDAIPGVIGYAVVVCLVAWLAGIGAWGYDWLGAGRIDGTLIRNG